MSKTISIVQTIMTRQKRVKLELKRGVQDRSWTSLFFVPKSFPKKRTILFFFCILTLTESAGLDDTQLKSRVLAGAIDLKLEITSHQKGICGLNVLALISNVGLNPRLKSNCEPAGRVNNKIQWSHFYQEGISDITYGMRWERDYNNVKWTAERKQSAGSSNDDFTLDWYQRG